MQHDRLAVTDQRGILLLQRAIGRPGPALRPVGRQLRAPARHIAGDALRLLFRCQDEIGEPGARQPLRDRGFRSLRRRRRGPFVGCPAGDDRYIVARLARQRAVAGQPCADAPGAGVVAGRGETEIAEPVAQVAQIARRMAQRPDRIERIGKAAPIGGARHELRDALRAGAAYRPRVEAALLPDDAGEELDRKLILRRVLLERAADVVRGRCYVRR